jgi:hypothetical protein
MDDATVGPLLDAPIDVHPYPIDTFLATFITFQIVLFIHITNKEVKSLPILSQWFFFTLFFHFDHVNPWLKTKKNLFPFSQRVCFLLSNLHLFIVPQYIPTKSNNEFHLAIICSVIYLKFCSPSKVWISMLKWLLTCSLEVQLVRIMKGEYLVLAWTPHLYPNKALSNW